MIDKKIKIIIIILLTGLCFVPDAKAQDPQFTQFYAAPQYISPSLAGGAAGTRAILNFRDQWPSIPNAFISTALSVDHNLFKYYSGLGLMLLHDRAGSGKLARTEAAFSYAYFAPEIAAGWYVRPGIQLKYLHNSIDYNSLTMVDQLFHDGPSLQLISIEPVQYLDAAVSVLGFNKRNWVGITIDHLTQPNQSLIQDGDAKVPITTRIYGGTHFPLGRDRGLHSGAGQSLFAAFHYKAQGKYDQFDLGAYFYKDPIILGLWYRGLPGLKIPPDGQFNHDMMALLIGVKTGGFYVGYSYDFTLSTLINSSGGAHEISLIYVLRQNMKIGKQGRDTKRAMSCPSIMI